MVAAPKSTPYLPEWSFWTSTIGMSPMVLHRAGSALSSESGQVPRGPAGGLGPVGATLPSVTRMPSESGSGREGPAVSEWRCRGSRRDGRGRAPRREAP